MPAETRTEVVERCHGCKRELPVGVMRLIVHSTAFRGMRQWCEDCQAKGKHRAR
jgi:hypothetical protein